MLDFYWEKDSTLGVNVSSQINEIAELKSENKKLSKLKSSIDTTATSIKTYAINATSSPKLENLSQYRQKAFNLVNVLNADEGYHYLEVYREKLNDKLVKARSCGTYTAVKIRHLKAVYNEISDIVSENEKQIATLESNINTIRKNAYNTYIARKEEEERQRRASAGLSVGGKL